MAMQNPMFEPETILAAFERMRREDEEAVRDAERKDVSSIFVKETVLDEAHQITAGRRQDAYGHPRDMAQRFAEIACACTDLDVEPHHFPLLMMAVKLARLAATTESWDRDTMVDIAGYARVAEMMRESDESR